jgi:hypothetical protein
MNSRNNWYLGLDYLRPLMSFAVIAWHLHLFGETGFFDIDKFKTQNISFVDIVYFQVLLLSVPTFCLISLFVFSSRRIINLKYLLKRIERLFYLYLFWLSTGLLIYMNIKNNSLLVLFNSLTSDFYQFVLFLFSGGFTLYYFFLNLIFLTILAYFTISWGHRLQWLLMGISTMLFWVIPAVVCHFKICEFLLAYWNVINFIPYVFISNLINHYKKKLEAPDIFWRCCFFLAILCFITAYCEWQWFVCIGNFKYNGFAIPPYMRISVAIGATLLLVSCLRIRQPAPKWIKFLSDCSLGLYCLHMIVIILLQKTNFYEAIHYFRFIEFVVVISISIVLTVLFRRAFRSGLI